MVYSLVQLPTLSVAVADLLDHSRMSEDHDRCPKEEGAELPGGEEGDALAVSFLRCMMLFAIEEEDGTR